MKQKPSIYLCGAIERSLDYISWRTEFKEKLSYKYNVIIPYAKSTKLTKDNPKYKKFVFDNYIVPDINDVISSKYFFVKIDKAVLRGAGTGSEICLARWNFKHMVYILEDGLTELDIPGWILGCLFQAKKVKTLDEAIDFYRNLKLLPDKNKLFNKIVSLSNKIYDYEHGVE
jgi:hypothetical protein